MKKRLLYYEIKPYISHKNAIIVVGMRQVGKTTLLKQIFDELENSAKAYFDLDNPLDQKFFEEQDYKNIFARLKSMVMADDTQRVHVFIDEIQNFPDITKVIKYLIDHYGVKFFLTGSSSFYLKNLFPESLSGRKFLYELGPLSFSEFLYFKDVVSLKQAQNNFIVDRLKLSDEFFHSKNIVLYEEYLEFGGFPEVIITDDLNVKKEVLKNIFASFFEKDIKIISDFKDVRELRDLILLLAPRVGSMLDVTKLASELSITRLRVYDYLEFLQGIFFIKLLSKHSKSVDRSVAGGRKVYFSDNGLLRTLGQVNEGQILENSLVNQLARFGKLSFYNKKNITETDIVLDGDYLLEVKVKGGESDYVKLAKIARQLKIDKYYIVSKNFQEREGFVSATVF